MFISLGIPESRISIDDRVIVDSRAFNQQVEPFPISEYISKKITGCPIIPYIGKINYYWHSKGLFELAEAVKEIKEDFLLLFVANGIGLEEFKTILETKGLLEKSFFLNFLPPSEIPSYIKLCSCVVLPEREFPIDYHVPILPKEVMAMGKCLILGKEIALNQHYGDLPDRENVLIVDPKNIQYFKDTIEYVIRNPLKIEEIGRNAYRTFKTVDDFNDFIDCTLDIYRSILEPN
jgi:glycosyltransferase involved in cell wall biosynthesis